MADNQDDAWLEQLREALASTDDESRGDQRPAFSFAGPTDAPPPEPPRPFEPLQPDRNPDPAPPSGPTDENRLGLAGVRDALRSLGSRMTAIESLTEDVARQSRRTSSAPDALMIEEIVTRVVRSELPAIIKEQLATLPAVAPTPMRMGQEALDRWSAQLEGGEISAAEVVMLADELRARITQLEDIQRQALEQLTTDRRELIDGAVSEIRKLLFGQ